MFAGKEAIRVRRGGPERGKQGLSARVIEVCLRFGVPAVGPSPPGGILDGLGLCFAPGRLVLVVGPSGSGKSRLLSEIARREPGSRSVPDVLFPLDVPVVDAVLPTRPLQEALSLLTACGLGEPSLWLRRFDQLSDGEGFRARLARAIGLRQRAGSRSPLLCDEFTSLLHRRLARSVSLNLRKLVTREGFSLVVATSREDVEAELRPDQVVRLSAGGVPVVEARSRESVSAPPPAACETSDLATRWGLEIERGSVRDYAAFAAMHYRQRENLGFVDRVFTLREKATREVLGIVVYGHPALELSLRNRVTDGRWVRDAERLNRELRVLKRLVIHPDVRGCGLGQQFVRATLPMAGVPFVECLAVMGAVHPVFERAGMQCVGACPRPVQFAGALRELRGLGADPLAADFVAQVCRSGGVRRVVASAVGGWYRATTGGGEDRVVRQTPSTLAHTFRQLAGSEPVYFIWARDAQGWDAIERGQDVTGHAAPCDV